MAKKVNKALPKCVSDALSQETIKVLQKDGYGINFADRFGLQLHVTSKEHQYHAYFNYAKNGGIEPTVLRAIQISKDVRKLFTRNKPVIQRHTKTCGVMSLASKNSNGSVTYKHIIRYYDVVRKKIRFATIQHPEETITTGQWLHGHHTALYFRELTHQYAQKGESVPNGLLLGWKDRRMYWLSNAPVDYYRL